VQAHPILPAPTILGTPPLASTGRDWRTDGPTTAASGAKGAHPILPDTLPSQQGGDVVPALAMPQSTESTILAKDRAASTVATSSQGAGASDATQTPRAGVATAIPPTPPVAPTRALPFTAALPMPTASTQTVQPLPPLPTQVSTATANSVPPTVSGAPKRRAGTTDGTNGGGAFAMADARLGNVTTTGGPPAATPTHPAVVNATREIVAQAQLLGHGQSAEMRLRLRPPELGEVGVTIRRTATGGLTMHINPASPAAAAVLRSHLPQLQTALDQQSQGQGAQVTLGQHDASGSSHRQGGGNGARGDEHAPPSSSTPTASRPVASARVTRNTALDYDA
nr:flagellar hook-length control protein FliK [Ktedonobacterales bacterium]